MFAVVFEVQPKQERWDEYLELAKFLKPELEKIDGFIDNERFESTRRPGWILSHSTWRDEKSVVRWRTVAKHHDTQQRGRDEVFQDYHLRVGEIVADTAPPAGTSLVEQRLDAPASDGVLVDEAGVEIADALCISVRGCHCGSFLAGFDDQVPHLLFGLVEQVAEGAVGGPVGRDVVVRQPAAVDVTEQVVLRAGTSVDIAQVDARAENFYRHATIVT